MSALQLKYASIAFRTLVFLRRAANAGTSDSSPPQLLETNGQIYSTAPVFSHLMTPLQKSDCPFIECGKLLRASA